MQHPVSVIDDDTGSATPAEPAAIDAVDGRLAAEGRGVFAADLDAALTIVAEGSKQCDRKVEVRPFLAGWA